MKLDLICETMKCVTTIKWITAQNRVALYIDTAELTPHNGKRLPATQEIDAIIVLVETVTGFKFEREDIVTWIRTKVPISAK